MTRFPFAAFTAVFAHIGSADARSRALEGSLAFPAFAR